MRLFPEDHRGLHPAYPAYPEESARHRYGFFNFLRGCGLFAVPVAAIAAGLRRPHPWITATKATAYLSAGLAVVKAVGVMTDDTMPRNFLRTQGIEPPERKLCDRLGHIDMDNAALIGGALGVLVTSLRKRPSPIHGWKRYFGAFSLGGATGTWSWVAYVDLKERWKGTSGEISKNVDELSKQETRWSPAVQRALGKPTKMTTSAAMQSTPDGGMLGAPGLYMGGSIGGPPRPRNGGEKNVGDPGQPGGDKLGRNGPHITVKQPGIQEPIYLPNYDWTSDHEIEDLEKHIAKLRQNETE